MIRCGWTGTRTCRPSESTTTCVGGDAAPVGPARTIAAAAATATGAIRTHHLRSGPAERLGTDGHPGAIIVSRRMARQDPGISTRYKKTLELAAYGARIRLHVAHDLFSSFDV